jgi:hypothetical protein
MADDAFKIVVGVVYPPGLSGGRSRGETDWTLMLTLRPWREEGKSLLHTALQLRSVVTKETLGTLQDEFAPYSLVRARVRLEEAGRAILQDDSLEAGDDAELAAEAARLQVPITKTIAPFGTLTYDRSVAWWSGPTVWNRKAVTLHLDTDEADGVDTSAEAARTLWAQQEEWQQRIGAFAVGELLPLKNDSWLDEDEKPVDEAAFLDRMTLESITVYADGSFSFYHDDGGLFAGHCIEVSGNLLAGPTYADIPG